MKGLTARLLIFNLLLAVFPLGAVFFLGTFETQRLESQERAMVQQGRLLASALDDSQLEANAQVILSRLGGRTDSRIRVVDAQGQLLADSARPAESPDLDEVPDADGAPAAPEQTSYPEESVLYRIGALPARVTRFFTNIIRPPKAPAEDVEHYSGRNILDGPEILSALGGRYGAVTRISRGQKSVTLYSAIPVLRGEEVIGAVLISRSTFAILSDLYQLRLDIMLIFLLSIAAAVLLSILLARTVTVPVGRLRTQAESLLDERGKLQNGFKPFSGQDEVADLSRALHRLSARLQDRARHTEDFIADLVHEMKNPVAGILSAAELAEDKFDKKLQRFLGVIDREARRIQRLLDGARELIRVDVHLDGSDRGPANMKAILETVVSAYPRCGNGGVEVRLVNESRETVWVDGNPDRLAQAVLNLVDNAVSFSPKGEDVRVLLEGEEGGLVKIHVLDRGPGIAPEMMENVFERWYTDRPAAEAFEHTGLGLAIVRGIAMGYGGRVGISPRSGGGMEFTLEFPSVRPG